MLKQRLYTSVLYINRNLHMAEHNIFLEEFCGEYLSLLEWKMSENPQPRFQVSPNEAMKTSPPKNLLWLSTRNHSFSLMNWAPNVLQNDCLSKNRKKIKSNYPEASSSAIIFNLISRKSSVTKNTQKLYSGNSSIQGWNTVVLSTAMCSSGQWNVSTLNGDCGMQDLLYNRYVSSRH